jgi:DNA polymerase-3 subunit delta'
MRTFRTLCPWLLPPFRALEQAALENRLGHGWLISGPSDIGKRNLAYLLAERLLNHETDKAPPESAAPAEMTADYEALATAVDLHPDLYALRAEEDKRTIVVDQVRELTSALTLKPLLAGLKVVVVEQAESMTIGAANALLKSLEEPTPNTWLFLLAERPGRLPATIRSRCQKLPLKPPGAAATAEWLESDGGAADLIPGILLAKAPLAAARLLADTDILNNYKSLYSDINAIYSGKGEPFAVAEKWQRGDPELALDCLVESLELAIRQRLVPERWTPVTDSNRQLADNSGSGIPTEALFNGLKLAGHLREQIGRGINVELAFKALLLGLDPSAARRVTM